LAVIPDYAERKPLVEVPNKEDPPSRRITMGYPSNADQGYDRVVDLTVKSILLHSPRPSRDPRTGQRGNGEALTLGGSIAQFHAAADEEDDRARC
jgi:hypothetical protein